MLAPVLLAVLAAPLGTLTVTAGDHDRQDTPVTFALPERFAGQALELRGRGGPIAVTVAPDGHATFVLPRLRKGASARFELTTPAKPPRPAVEVQPGEGGLAISIGGKPAFHYRSEGAAPDPSIKPEYVRGGYLHPVFTPGGRLVTDDYPKDHRHHHGIWTAWTSTEFEGRKPDFWNMGKKSARKDHVSLGATYSGAAAGGFQARLSSTDLGATPPKAVLLEDWHVIAYRAPKPARHFLFDLRWTDSVVGDAPLVLPEYRYGGLGLRGAPGWVSKDAVTLLTSEGKDRGSGDGTGARWCHMGGKIDGKPAGIAVLGHPENVRAPQPLRLHPDDPYLSFAPSKAGKLTIEPGKPLVSRYRFVVGDGPADAATLDRLWNDYAHPPAVTLALSAP